VETASVEGFTIAVDGPASRGAAPPRDWRGIALAGLAALALLAAGIWLLRCAAPPTGRFNSARRAARLATENHAYTELRRAMARHGNAALRPLLDACAERVTGPDPRAELRLHAALTLLGTALYGSAAPRDPTAA
jgi:hypothetical protein